MSQLRGETKDKRGVRGLVSFMYGKKIITTYVSSGVGEFQAV